MCKVIGGKWEREMQEIFVDQPVRDNQDSRFAVNMIQKFVWGSRGSMWLYGGHSSAYPEAGAGACNGGLLYGCFERYPMHRTGWQSQWRRLLEIKDEENWASVLVKSERSFRSQMEGKFSDKDDIMVNYVYYKTEKPDVKEGFKKEISPRCCIWWQDFFWK